MSDPTLTLRLDTGASAVQVDFPDFDGRPLSASDRAALRDALDAAVSALNSRLARVPDPDAVPS